MLDRVREAGLTAVDALTAERPPGTVRGRTGYALCADGRSGSNWFCEVLASTGVLGRPLEYFNAAARRMHTDPAYPDHPVEQIDRILTTGTTSNSVYALKVFPSHLDAIASRVRWTTVLPRLRFVHWTRRDALGQALSLVRAAQTARWRSSEPSAAEPAYDGERILAALHEFARRNARWRVFFARNDIGPLEMSYEDAQRDPQAAVDAVAALLDVGVRPTVDFARVTLTVQRDADTAAWRDRFVAEYGDPDRIDVIT